MPVRVEALSKAPVNGSSNYNCSMVAKFLVGLVWVKSTCPNLINFRYTSGISKTVNKNTIVNHK